MEDVRRRKLLEEKYPGRIMTVIYDDFVRGPKEYARKIYRFLGLELRAEEVLKVLGVQISMGSISGNETATLPEELANKWRKTLTHDVSMRIMDNACEEFFKTVKYAWKI